MIFSSDSELWRFQPYVFEHGVLSFEELHSDAARDIVAAIATEWGPSHYVVLVDEFDEERLDASQWMMASVYRVLGWYVLPMLAASVGGQGFVTMMEHYRREYAEEMRREFRRGVRYDTGSGFERGDALPESEVQRLRR
jgi:hypothetical protein